ncbi:MAG: DUF4331 domain-containing protein [Pseudomonadota bacterium]|nr:DUF4331 domain-containing protein [Pseudomonadota bacterium]
MKYAIPVGAALLGAALLPMYASASSHREAPAIAGMPRLDGTDFYMFRSYEPGRSGYVTFIANYIPLQDPAGGPNFYNLDTNGLYNIHIDNTGRAVDNLNFQFRFTNTVKNLAVNAGGKSVPVALDNIGPVDVKAANVNVTQSYTVEVIRNSQPGMLATNATHGGTTFYKPVDNIGNKSIADYAAYAGNFVQEINVPGCAGSGRVFVGQRKEGFFINIGEVFDLVNLNPVAPRDSQPNTLFAKNVTSIALELPIKCVTSGADPVISAFTTASVVTNQKVGNNFVTQQVSRLGMPLVNELVIGLPDKDKFNASAPANDTQFINYVTNPSLPVLLNVLFGNAAMVPGTPRNDLVAAFLTGVKGINQPMNVQPSEMLRLNTSVAPTPPGSQSDLGVLGGDMGGFPNGRRPYDDVVDITLRVAEGALCGVAGNCGSEKADPNHGTPYTDGTRAAGPDAAHSHVTGAIKASDTFLPGFPYLNTPVPGSPNSVNGVNGTVSP